MKIVIPGEPVAKGRPRFGNGRTYTPEKTQRWEQMAGWQARLQGAQVMAGPLRVRLEAVFRVPRSWSKAKAAAAARGEIPHVSKPDIDNLMKALDSLNGIAWVDDAQIVEATVRKSYGATPGVTVTVEVVR